jgi:branched-chain amino acid transport system permease protein
VTAVLLDGVAFGLQLALLAVGLTMIHGLGGVLNLAHGQFAATTAVIGARLIGGGLPVVPAVTAAVATAGLLAVVLDATLMRPVYRLHGEDRVLSSLLVTLGLAFVIDGLLIRFAPFALLNLSVPGPAVGVVGVPMRRGAVAAALLAAVVLLGLVVALRGSRWGRAVRAVIQDDEGARLCGIDPTRIRRSVFALGGVLAGLVAVTQGLTAPIGATSGRDLTVLALIVTVVGGLGRVSGALIAGVLLGVVHAIASYTLGAFTTVVLLLLVAIAVILVRPTGIVRSVV